MEYYVNGNKIKINKSDKVFAKGSEGMLYLIDNNLYKIYYSNALNDGFGNKEKYHKALLGLHDEVKQIVLPTDLIFDLNCKYSGYKTPLVGEMDKNRIGIIKLNWDKVISNIETLEYDSTILSNNRFYMVDFSFHNMVFSKKEEKLYAVDPGRYHHETYFSIGDYKRINNLIVKECFLNQLRQEILSYKLIKINKSSMFISKIKDEMNDLTFSQYLTMNSSKYPSIEEFIKTKIRYIK